MIVYSLKNCDSCKKAIKWLDGQNLDFTNHDIRADGLDQSTVKNIVDALGWETALNRRSTTLRNLDEEAKADLNDQRAIDLILQHPTLMKRPVFVRDGGTMCGFSAQVQDWLQS